MNEELSCDRCGSINNVSRLNGEYLCEACLAGEYHYESSIMDELMTVFEREFENEAQS